MRKISILLAIVLLAIPLGMSGETLRGDINGDEAVNINDVTDLIDYLLTGDDSLIDIENADVENNGSIAISDVTTLIDYLLTGEWPDYTPHTETFTVNGVSFTMVTVEGGTFMMGATAEQGTTDPFENEYPVHQVTLSTFSIGQTEVTQELWMAVMNDPIYDRNPSYYSSANGFEDDFSRPVENMSLSTMEIFITRLNLLTGRQFHLPTEAQWEFAARGGNLSKGYKYSGSDDPDEVAWYQYNCPGGTSSPTHPVATKKPNELGIYDMSGNVWERCSDEYSDEYSSEPQTDPTGPPHNWNVRVARGGSFWLIPRYIRVSSRRECGYHSGESGFRLAL